MCSLRSDLAKDCGWAWTSNFKLMRTAPGMLTE
jgi:hypothetical protein